MLEDQKIDFVVPWVDNSDPVWQAAFKKHKGDETLFTDTSDKRYRDWGLFKYWFRGVEKYAPWVNRIHLITCGHYPDWLNLNHPKLNFVKHEDYMPKEYLPTFSSTTIELNLHRIDLLAEQFVYFNDDIFLINKTTPKIFFDKGLPRDSAVMTAYSGLMFSFLNLNSTKITNLHFDKRHVLKSHFFNWFNYKYGFDILKNFFLLPWQHFTGFTNYHLHHNYLKNTFKEVWEKNYEELEQTSLRKFRHNLDLNQFVFRNWQLASNTFKPINPRKLGFSLSLGIGDTNKQLEKFSKSKKPIICLNDHDPENLDEVIYKLTEIFEKKFPEKSSFEL